MHSMDRMNITVEGMDKSVEILMELVKIYGIIKKE